jgi:hypothetical protein
MCHFPSFAQTALSGLNACLHTCMYAYLHTCMHACMHAWNRNTHFMETLLTTFRRLIVLVHRRSAIVCLFRCTTLRWLALRVVRDSQEYIENPNQVLPAGDEYADAADIDQMLDDSLVAGPSWGGGGLMWCTHSHTPRHAMPCTPRNACTHGVLHVCGGCSSYRLVPVCASHTHEHEFRHVCGVCVQHM